MKTTLEQALADYEAESVSLGHSPEYTRVTFVFLRKFKAACETEKLSKASDLNVRAITPGCITRYFSGLQGLAGSHNRALSAVRGFLDYLENRELIQAGTRAKLLRNRKNKVHQRKRKHYIPVEQFGEMLELSGRRHAADRAAMAVVLYTLARQGEIASIKLSDVNFANSTIRIHRHKRDRWTDVTICPDLADELINWLQTYANEAAPSELYSSFLPSHPDWYLIPHLKPVMNSGPYDADLTTYKIEPDKPMARLENVIKNALDVLGADTQPGISVKHLGEGMHTVRRSGARAMFDHLADDVGEAKALLQTSIMLDHDDPQMTLRYIDKDIERDRLSEYLKTGSMYGPGHRARAQGNVVPIRRTG